MNRGSTKSPRSLKTVRGRGNSTREKEINLILLQKEDGFIIQQTDKIPKAIGDH